MDDRLLNFIAESNRIEGIARPVSAEEIAAHEAILALRAPGVPDLESFVATVAPGSALRTKRGMNVRVGSYIAPPGGKQIAADLERILNVATSISASPYTIHHEYERLHPFTDGNGRSGRALWLWMMDRRGYLDRALNLGFLHCFYYQSLESER